NSWPVATSDHVQKHGVPIRALNNPARTRSLTLSARNCSTTCFIGLISSGFLQAEFLRNPVSHGWLSRLVWIFGRVPSRGNPWRARKSKSWTPNPQWKWSVRSSGHPFARHLPSPSLGLLAHSLLENTWRRRGGPAQGFEPFDQIKFPSRLE